ncbi:Membrane fusion protein [Winogradskyella psychrotolerans RS-3]|uniref:Membrane fusion protein n=1 Tax=Winogradskyella psychrotolerans RS-3 TaxID=641526 RepID=S7VTL3_9FLAO|nr:HlyD family efflux transporter periplasmic adaptor subunit [Winogradskyella psychrotolerans]EPR73416.1 Membrane fusion protein [Winogradskyella psychrotolerans RS-3]
MKFYSVLFIFLILLSCGTKQEKILPEERALTEAVYSSAIIQPDSLYQVYAIVSGILDANLVEEGDLVSKGKPLMQIINSTPEINSQNAKLALHLAQQNYTGSAAILSSIEDEITAATLTYKNDSINYHRQKNLWDQHIGSKVQYDTKKLNYELASTQLKLLRNKYNRTKNELNTAVKQAQNNYQSSSILNQDFTVESKINGKIYALYKEPGEIVTTMEPIASIGSANRFIIELLVDEVDIVRIALNQEVVISLDAYAAVLFKGKISKIYPKKDERNQTFKVEAIFVEQPKVLYPGLSGEANIIIAKKEKVLTLPKSYLIDGNKVKTDEGIVTIKTGLENMDYIEIVSGISKDTYVYKQN